MTETGARACPELPAILLMGPTASGKSALAMSLAQRFRVEIVSVDSAQVYRGMDIGTAKPDPATRAQVRHHLIDIIDPGESYSAARFCSDAAHKGYRGNAPAREAATHLAAQNAGYRLRPLDAAAGQGRRRIRRAERAARLTDKSRRAIINI